MNRKRIILFLLVLLAGVALIQTAPQDLRAGQKAGDSPIVYVLDVDGSINPAVMDHIKKGIDLAEEEDAAALLIRLDTPGGLVSTTKSIIKAMMNSPVPVIVYVAPGGSSASSAGALITMGADIAAMAPGTNIGAAHPVPLDSEKEISGPMADKLLNDLTAYMRGIVKKRGRNAEWAEKAIRASLSVTAKEALKLKVIDVVAPSIPDLLKQIDGRVVEKGGKEITLETKSAQVRKYKSGWRFKILDAVANPNIAYILIMGAMLGLMMEIYNPGMILPGVLGVICLVLAGFALQVLPVNYIGILLLILGIVLFILEVKITSFGLLSMGGIVCLLLGSIMLFETGESAMRVSWAVILPTVGCFSVFFIAALTLAVRAWRSKPQTGVRGLEGEIGVAVSEIGPDGKIFVHGEYWNAKADSVIPNGERVRVIRVDGLTVHVTRDASG